MHQVSSSPSLESMQSISPGERERAAAGISNAQGMFRRTSMSVSKDSILRASQERRGFPSPPKEEHLSLLKSPSDASLASINSDSQVLSVNIQNDPFEQVRQQRRTLDVVLVFLVLLFAESARGIVLPTLAPYVEKLGGDSTMLGVAVAAFSVGRFASTIGLGYLSTRLSYKVVLAWSVGFCVIGNGMYSFGTILGPLGIWVLLLSRFIAGFGAGTLSVVRAYVAHVTLPVERTSYMSMLGAVQFLGFAITPGIGSILAIVPGYSIYGLPFDKFTYPGYFLAFTNALVLVALLVWFQNPPPQEAKPAAVPATAGGPGKAPSRTRQMVIAFGVFLGLNLLVRCVLGILETLGTPLYIDVWHGDESKATEAGFVFAGMGFVGVFVLFGISYVSKWVSDFYVLVCGLVFLILGCGLMIGDNMGLARFIAGAGLIWCIGFPLAQTIIVSMFSKMLGKAPQGTWMGWIGAMGSAGRIVGPIVAGYLYEHVGHAWAMIFGTAMAVASLVLTIPIFPRRRSQL